MQTVKFISGSKMVKTIPDGIIFHGGDPEAFHGLAASSQIIDGAENQFTLTASITGIDDTGDIFSVHQGFQYIELIPFILRNPETEGRWDDGEIFFLPFGIPLVIIVGICQTRQMPKAPGYEITVALLFSRYAFASILQ